MAFEYLTSRRGSKGQEILDIADYLLPSSNLNVKDQKDRCRLCSGTNKLPSNYGERCFVKLDVDSFSTIHIFWTAQF